MGYEDEEAPVLEQIRQLYTRLNRSDKVELFEFIQSDMYAKKKQESDEFYIQIVDQYTSDPIKSRSFRRCAKNAGMATTKFRYLFGIGIAVYARKLHETRSVEEYDRIIKNIRPFYAGRSLPSWNEVMERNNKALTSIDKLPLPVRVKNALSWKKITHLEELQYMTEKDLLSLKLVGRKGLAAIRVQMDMRNIKFLPGEVADVLRA